jgi:hypothetical protein
LEKNEKDLREGIRMEEARKLERKEGLKVVKGKETKDVV